MIIIGSRYRCGARQRHKNGMDMPSSAYGPSGTMHGNGEDMAVTVSFPIASNMENIDVYEITDGKAELLSSEQDGDYISVDKKSGSGIYTRL